MSESRMKDLFDVARDDGPPPSARAEMWAGIQTATLGAPSAAFAAKGAGILSSKLALGIALGASMTVGIAATALAIARTTHVPAFSQSSVATPRSLDVDRVAEPERPVEAVRTPVVITGHVANGSTENPIELKDEDESHLHHARASQSAVLSEHDRLALEARMVSEARGALHRGDADAALRIVRAARTQPGARLVPEELTVEAQALHALGDDAAAKRVEADLAGRFPEQTPETGVMR